MIPRKSNNSDIVTASNIDKYIEEYLSSHPEALNKYLENYIKNNISILKIYNRSFRDSYGKILEYYGLIFRKDYIPFAVSNSCQYVDSIDDYKKKD